jgi:hypothetical protein
MKKFRYQKILHDPFNFSHAINQEDFLQFEILNYRLNRVNKLIILS